MTKQDEPYGFQGIGIFCMRRQHEGFALNADDPGLGKTCQAILASLPFRRKRPIVVVCPAGVKYHWEREVKKWAGFHSWVCEGQKPPKQKPLSIPPVIIVNWEILQYWWKFLRSLNPSVIIPDEIHYGKNRGALRTKALVSLCSSKGINAIYGLSGTPFENCPAELFTALNLLRPDLFPKFRPFGDRFCDPKRTYWGMKYEGATRKKELRKLLKKSCMVRRRYDQVVKDLPPLQRSVIPLKINRKKYVEAQDNIVKWLIKNRPEKAYKARFVNHLAKLNYLLQYTAELKIIEVQKWIQNFLDTTDEKLVVFGYHRAFLEALHDKFKSNSVLRYGGLSNKKKELVQEQFVKNRAVRILFMSSSGMTGIDGLQKVCWNMAVCQLTWNALKMIQLEKRLHRLLQKNPVNISYLMAKDTVESLLCSAVIRKQKNFNRIIDGKGGRVEFDVLKTVMKKLTKKR